MLALLVLCEFQAVGAALTGIKHPKAGETVEVLVHYAKQPTDDQPHPGDADRGGPGLGQRPIGGRPGAGAPGAVRNREGS